MSTGSAPEVPRLETARLILDAHDARDLPALAAMWADPAVVRHIGAPATAQQSWFRLLRYRGLWPVLGYGYWAIRARETGRFLGDIGFADFERGAQPSISGIPEAGWVLASDAHGQGYGREALTAALGWLDRKTPHLRCICLIDAANAASIRLAASVGFVAAGTVMLGDDSVGLFARDRG